MVIISFCQQQTSYFGQHQAKAKTQYLNSFIALMTTITLLNMIKQQSFLQNWLLSKASSNFEAIIDKLTIDLDSPNSCFGYTTVLVTQIQDLISYDYSSKVTYGQMYYQSRLQPAYDDYWELLRQPDKFNFYEPKVFKCKGDQPRFSSNLINQIIQLPISTPKIYTFDFPVDCFQNNLIFTWSVDFYASPPSFLTFTTAGTQATLSMNPTVSNIGTYSIKVVFTNSKDPLLFSQDYFQVEVYPEVSYTDSIKCLECPSRPMSMAFGIQADYVINYMDIYSKADYYVLCGSTKTLQTIADTYSQSFILQYTRGFAMTFHITMEAGSINSFAQQCNFGYKNNIQTMIQSFSQILGAVDAVYIITHLNSGKFVDGRVLKMQDLNLRADQMIVDSSQGDTYLMGKQTDTLFAFNNAKHVFLMKYDRFYEIQFFRFYENGPSEGREITIDYSNMAIYMIHTYFYQSFSKNYYAVVKVDFFDGGLIWAKTLRDNSGGMTTTGSELYLSRHNSDTGMVLSQLQFGFNSGNNVYGCTLEYSMTSSQLIMQYGGTASTYIGIINIAVTPMTVKSQMLKTMVASSINNKQYLIEINSALFTFISYVLGTITYMTVFRINDFTSPGWESPCTSGSIQTVDTSVYSGFNLPNGINGDQSIHWKDLTPYTSRLAENQFIGVYFTKMMNFRAYPVTNSSADVRANLGSCSFYSNPSYPQISNRVGAYINSSVGSIPVSKLSYPIILPPFQQCSNDPMTFTLKQSTGAALPSFMVYNLATNTLNITPNQNSYQGIYTLRYQATIAGNEAPYVLEDFNSNVVIFAHHNYEWLIYQSFDREMDISSFEAFILDANNATISVPWFQLLVSNQDQISFIVNNPSQPASGTQTQYYIQVNIWDEWNVLTKRSYFISLIIKDNLAPYLAQTVSNTIPAIYITQKFQFSFPYSFVFDREDDTVQFTCTTSTNNGLSANWITTIIDPLSNVSILGQSPRDNSYAGTYTFTCQLNDQYDGPPNIYTFSLDVLPKPQVQINQVQNDIRFLIPENITQNFDGFFSDQFGEPFTIKLLINGTLYNPMTIQWLDWNTQNLKMDIKGTNNSFGGNHSIQIQLDDSISVPSTLSFKVEIIQNWPLRILKPLKDISTQTNSAFMKSINVTNEEDSKKQLPYFIFQNFPNGTFGGYTNDANIGSYNLECIGVDNANQQTSVKFKFICQACWDIDYNACEECKQGFYFYFNECLDQCFPGTYADDIDKTCKKCPQECVYCSGPDSTFQCSRCKAGFYSYNGGCWKTCPDGFYGDNYEGIQCHRFCTKCYGPSYSNCYSCEHAYQGNEKNLLVIMGYLLIGTECKAPKCKEKQYFEWFPYLVNNQFSGQCQDCHSTCKRCIGRNVNDCLQCIQGYEFNEQLFICIKCEDFYGIGTNQEGECEDICGDGIVVEKQCDDGNLISGDGCNDQCELEFGYECIFPNQTCRENISPDFQIISRRFSFKIQQQQALQILKFLYLEIYLNIISHGEQLLKKTINSFQIDLLKDFLQFFLIFSRLYLALKL
ncbi:cadg multi-domain protein [Stylonychia lemnae]|uniref:Cadg multi-domain protein n=1 Tax=Stylonychia lemnae TaxID=5949 RepID=A0A078AKJ2_STYLE|nr:cadg multi-domain protein [Stylonychia lemnae]|eukprot:CDW81957.1 cadg multi-domain protein [Stylonychia lemnae]